MNITDIPLNDLRLLFTANDLTLPETNKELYQQAKAIIINGRVSDYPDSVIDWIIAYNLIPIKNKIKSHSKDDLFRMSPDERLILMDELGIDNSDINSLINVLTYLDKLTKYEIMTDDIKINGLLNQLGIEAFLSFCAVDVYHRKLCNDDHLWQSLYQQDFQKDKIINNTYKENYILAYKLRDIKDVYNFPVSLQRLSLAKGFRSTKFGTNIEDDSGNYNGYPNEKFPANIGVLTNLTYLYITELLPLPTGIWELYKLESLILNKSRLNNLDKDIGRLVNLTQLDLSFNNLTFLPEELYQLTKLKNLELDHNNLRSLSNGIENLSDLEKLYLNFNNLLNLPNHITKLTKLESLYFHGNQITFLPNNMSALERLNVLDYDKSLKNDPEILAMENNAKRNMKIILGRRI